EFGNNGPEYYDEYEIDLREYIILLWNNKLFIGAIVVLAVIAAFVISSFVLSPQYESEANIIAPNFQLLNGNVVSNEDYIAVLTGDMVMKEILDIVNQERSKDNEIKIQGLLDRLNYSMSENTDQINFKFNFNDPEKTQSILKQWINIFINRVEEFLVNENNSYYKNIENKANADYKKYQTALEKLTNFGSENNLNFLRKNLDNKESKVIKLNLNIMDLKNVLEAEKKELEYITSRLENTERYLVRKNLISDEFLQKLQAVNSQTSLINLLNTEEEFLNPEFENLINREINLSTRITSKENNLENYIEDREKLNQEISELQKKISVLSKEKIIIQDELTNSEKSYNISNEKIRSLDQALAEREFNFIVLSTPNLPEDPVSPNTKLNVAIAAVLGLMLAVFIVFFK
ncbi:MAG: lipopolysaccharide biosynthesis protein, partial [Halanaerobium sp. T82-1]